MKAYPYFQSYNSSIQTRLGHSYFIKKNLDDVGIKRIWKYAGKPILEEYYFEDPDQIADIESEFPIPKNE